MAKSRRLEANPAVRSLIRQGMRGGLSDAEVTADVESHYPQVDPDRLAAEVRSERRRHNVVDTVESADKRKNIDLGRRLGCRGKNARARWGITIYWIDPTTGQSHQFNWTGETSVRGRLADLINQVINAAIAQAVLMGYTPNRITSGSTTQSAHYRINYVECV